MARTPFSKLPAELRDRIFEYVLVREDPILITRHREVENQNRCSTTAVLLVCRKFNLEGFSIFYGCNRFLQMVDTSYIHINDISLWRSTIGASKFQALRHLIIDIGHVNPLTNNGVSTASLMQDLVSIAKGCDNRCMVWLKLRLLTRGAGIKGGGKAQTTFDIILDVRNLESSLHRSIGVMKRRMEVEEIEEEWLEPFMGNFILRGC